MMATALFSCKFTKRLESSADQERYSGSRFMAEEYEALAVEKLRSSFHLE